MLQAHVSAQHAFATVQHYGVLMSQRTLKQQLYLMCLTCLRNMQGSQTAAQSCIHLVLGDNGFRDCGGPRVVYIADNTCRPAASVFLILCFLILCLHRFQSSK